MNVQYDINNSKWTKTKNDLRYNIVPFRKKYCIKTADNYVFVSLADALIRNF